MNNTQFEQKKADFKRATECILEAILLFGKHDPDGVDGEAVQALNETIKQIEESTTDDELDATV